MLSALRGSLRSKDLRFEEGLEALTPLVPPFPSVQRIQNIQGIGNFLNSLNLLNGGSACGSGVEHRPASTGNSLGPDLIGFAR